MRNRFLCLCILLTTLSGAVCQQFDTLPDWRSGYFDIHHISTGRGNSTFMVFPDGTTMLVDAGDISETHPRTLSDRNSTLKPDRSKSAPLWIVDYIRQFAPKGRPAVLDYAMITHYHDDHFGEWDETRPFAANGGYALTGIMSVGSDIPIRTLIDRGSEFPVDLHGSEFRTMMEDDEYHIVQTLDAYWKFIEFQTRNSGLQHETLKAGSRSQIIPRYDRASYSDFVVRNISVNGQVWTGYADDEYFELFQQGQYPGENPLSTCLRFSYGPFDYFTGGDISGNTALGDVDINSVESQVAPVIGPVDVSVLNHHGNRDSQNSYYVRCLRPRVWIGQTWSSDHPGHEVLRRITSQALYPGDRDVFSTDFLAANALVIGNSIDRLYKSLHGHVVVRVSPGGSSYEIYVLDDRDMRRPIMARFGPYQSR